MKKIFLLRTMLRNKIAVGRNGNGNDLGRRGGAEDIFLPSENGVFQPRTNGLEKRTNTRAKKSPLDTAIGTSSRGASS